MAIWWPIFNIHQSRLTNSFNESRLCGRYQIWRPEVISLRSCVSNLKELIHSCIHSNFFDVGKTKQNRKLIPFLFFFRPSPSLEIPKLSTFQNNLWYSRWRIGDYHGYPELQLIYQSWLPLFKEMKVALRATTRGSCCKRSNGCWDNATPTITGGRALRWRYWP